MKRPFFVLVAMALVGGMIFVPVTSARWYTNKDLKHMRSHNKKTKKPYEQETQEIKANPNNKSHKSKDIEEVRENISTNQNLIGTKEVVMNSIRENAILTTDESYMITRNTKIFSVKSRNNDKNILLKEISIRKWHNLLKKRKLPWLIEVEYSICSKSIESNPCDIGSKILKKIIILETNYNPTKTKHNKNYIYPKEP